MASLLRVISAGILLYRRRPKLEVLLVHPGGPYWARRDEGAWSIPKGLAETGEDLYEAALREFAEETGHPAPCTDPIPLGSVTLRSGKTVHAWACEGDLDPAALRSNTFTMEWPPDSDTTAEFPEVDRAEWFPVEAARSKLNPGQVPFVDRLVENIQATPTGH